ncbi:DUF2793 domain-containing protein [Hyphomonadaceae bacterium BL14]|nr:DUF2793 domain-containing protein [Hyphomonadaceae bacterium BL14]
MSDATPRLGLPWLMPAQAQKHVTVNEALGRLDALVQAHALSASLVVQPAGPAPGDSYVLPEGCEGADWDVFDPGSLVWFQDGAWQGTAPRAGLVVFVADIAALMIFDGSAWRELDALIRALANLEGLGVGTVPDAVNRFAAKLNTALWTALTTGEGGTGDLRYTLNKEGAGHVLSLLFQSGWSGRAELGLIGDDDLALRVSSDGADWIEALKVNRQTGALSAQGQGVIHRGNLVGTAAFDGSAPAGAVIEHGSNANGQYTRFADGTQICATGVIDFGVLTGAGTGSYADPWRTDPAVTVIWPAAFIAPPAPCWSVWPDQGGADPAARAIALTPAGAPTATQWDTLRCMRFSASSHASRALGRITAFGRWA